jgi:CubicO group peptidase (beta-lactamase class C family)
MNKSCWRTLAVLVVAAIALGATGGFAEDTSPRGLPCCDPASVGMDADGLAPIAARMREFVDDGQIAGAVTLVARRGCVVSLEAVGFANIEEKRPMTKDTLFAIASMTKPITATAVLMLQDEKKLSIDDPVSKYIPQFKEVSLAGAAPAREITLRDLLTHTAGLVGEQRCEQTLKETAEMIAKRPLGFQPGSRWQYSPGLNVCGRVIEIVSGQPYDQFLQERILRPLKMADTTFHPTPEQRKRLAQLYKPGTEKKSLEPASHWLREDWEQRAPNPSGGLLSTAADMARFYQMILAGGQLDGARIVSQAAIEQMTRIQTGDLTTGFTPGHGWGLGWCVVREPQGVTKMLSPGTYGHGGAFGTQGWIDPQRGMIFVLMIQRTGFGNSDGSDIRGALQQTAVQAIRN